jgi:hypothetical protein
MWVAGMLADWPAYFLGVPFVLALARRRQWRKALVVCVLPPAMYAATMAAYGLINGQGLRFPLEFLVSNMAPHYDASRYDFDTRWSTILGKVWAYAKDNFGSVLIAAGLLGTIRAFVQPGFNAGIRFMLSAFLVVGVLNILAFKFWAAEHSFWSYYFLPVLALGFASLVYRIRPLHVAGLLAAIVILTYPVWRHGGPSRTRSLGQQAYAAFVRGRTQQMDPELLAFKEAASRARNIYSDTGDTYFGFGYIARWYADRPLTDLKKLDPAADCGASYDLVLLRDQAMPRVPEPAKAGFKSIYRILWWASVAELSKTSPEACRNLRDAFEK